MNSMSKGYYDPCKKHENFEREHCRHEHCEHEHCECENCRRERCERENCRHEHCEHENCRHEHCEHEHCRCERCEHERCRHEHCEHEHCEHKHCERDHCEKECKNEKHCPTIIKCGSPSSTTIPVATKVGTTFIVSSLTLDNSCLCNPITKLEFASNLVIPVAFTGTLNFQVFKICKCQLTPVPVGPAWTFDLVELISAKTFSFFVCDCDSCFNECCTYTVVATVTSPVTVGTLNINNATLGAISTCSTCGRNSCC